MIEIAAIMRDVTKRFENMRALKQNLAEATKSLRGCSLAPVRRR